MSSKYKIKVYKKYQTSSVHSKICSWSSSDLRMLNKFNLKEYIFITSELSNICTYIYSFMELKNSILMRKMLVSPLTQLIPKALNNAPVYLLELLQTVCICYWIMDTLSNTNCQIVILEYESLIVNASVYCSTKK